MCEQQSVVETAGEVFAMEQPDCGSAVCMFRAAGLFCQCVLVCRGTCSWSHFRVKLEMMRGGKAPAGEM